MIGLCASHRIDRANVPQKCIMPSNNVKIDKRRPTPRGGKLAPDPELWEAIGRGDGLRASLEDFYAQVFQDDRLAPFFEGVRKEFVVDKQFSFLRSILTGERNYFGNHPRRAHAWMVISDELFEHREDLLEQTLLRRGLSAHLASRIRSLNEIFRGAIVKDEPLKRIVNGRTIPTEGYESIEIAVGALCDGCQGEVSAGDRVIYHVRTGKTYCLDCAPEEGTSLAPLTT